MNIINDGINIIKNKNLYTIKSLYNYKSVLKKVVLHILSIDDNLVELSYDFPIIYSELITLYISSLSYYSRTNTIIALCCWTNFFCNDYNNHYKNLLAWNSLSTKQHKLKNNELDYENILSKSKFLFNYFVQLNNEIINIDDKLIKLTQIQDAFICFFCSCFVNINLKQIYQLDKDSVFSLQLPIFCDEEYIWNAIKTWIEITDFLDETKLIKKINRRVNVNNILNKYLGCSFYQIKILYFIYESKLWEPTMIHLEFT